MEDKMKIDISSLIGDLVEATVKSLKEVKGNPDIPKGDGTVKYKTAIGYTEKQRQKDPEKQTAYDAAVALRDGKKDDEEESPAQQTTDTQTTVPDEVSGDDAAAAVGDEGGEEEKEYNKEEAEAKLSEAGFTDGKVPDDINESDPSIQEAYDNGYNTNEETGYSPAPGNDGSLMNEVVSTVGVNMIRAMRPPTPTAEQLAEQITRVYGKTAAIQGVNERVREEQVLIAAQAALAKNTVIDQLIENNPNLSENSEVLSYYGSGTSLRQQYDLIQEMKGKEPPTVLYDDKGNQITSIPKDIRTVRQVLGWTNPKTGEKFTPQEVSALLKDQTPEGVLEFLSLAALNGGGGGNPSDTAQIVRDGNNLTFMGYSDKQSLNDQQANSTPAQLLNEYREVVETLKELDYEFPEGQEEEIEAEIGVMEEEFAEAERSLSRAALMPAAEMAEQMGVEENRDIILKLLNDDALAGPNATKKSAKNRRKYIENIKKGKAVARKPDGVELIEPEKPPTWNKYLEEAGVKEGEEPTQEQQLTAMFLLRSDRTEVTVKMGEPPEETVTTIGQLYAQGHSSRIIGELTKGLQEENSGYTPKNSEGEDKNSALTDYGIELGEARQRSIESLQKGIERLNKYSIEDPDGVRSNLGDVMAGADLVDKLHLYAIDGKDAPGLYGWGAIRLIAGPHIVDEAAMRECTGAENSEELLTQMQARPPKAEGPKYGKLYESQLQRARVTANDQTKAARTRDGDYVFLTKQDTYWYGQPNEAPEGARQLGRITGQKALIFITDKEGNEREIGLQTFRSKQGDDGKLGTSYSFSKDFQECLAKQNKD